MLGCFEDFCLLSSADWRLGGCAVQAGGAYTLNTGGSVTVRSTIRRLREQIEI